MHLKKTKILRFQVAQNTGFWICYFPRQNLLKSCLTARVENKQEGSPSTVLLSFGIWGVLFFLPSEPVAADYCREISRGKQNREFSHTEAFRMGMGNQVKAQGLLAPLCAKQDEMNWWKC